MTFLNAPFRGFAASCLNVAFSVNRSIHTNSQPLWFHHSPLLWAEPLRKKKRIDPQIIRERAEKKIKRIQRDIRRLEKVSRQFKPITELQPPKHAMRDSERLRPPPVLTESEIKERMELKQLWAIYKRKQHVAEMQAMQRVIDAQEKALDALQEVSPELYEAAIQDSMVAIDEKADQLPIQVTLHNSDKPDPNFLPFTMQGPVETPPIPGYDYPDGDYSDITKVYQPILPTDPKRLRQLGLHKKKL